MNNGNCALCGNKVRRLRERNGEPYKYCSPECDKLAMSLRMRSKVRPRILRVKKLNTWKRTTMAFKFVIKGGN